MVIALAVEPGDIATVSQIGGAMEPLVEKRRIGVTLAFSVTSAQAMPTSWQVELLSLAKRE